MFLKSEKTSVRRFFCYRVPCMTLRDSVTHVIANYNVPVSEKRKWALSISAFILSWLEANNAKTGRVLSLLGFIDLLVLAEEIYTAYIFCE